jgi:alpha-beta hydrolase superfamily lysophospholipase
VAPKAVLVIVHGLFEYCGRYRLLGEFLADRGYCVYAMDLRGHGLSQGKRVWVRSFSDYANDLGVLIQHIHEELPSTKIFILGHCMGALVAINYTIKHQHSISGLITSGALLKLKNTPPTITLAKTYVFGNLPVLSSKIGIPLFYERGISRSQRVVKAYIEDPLVFHGNVTARLGLVILKQMRLLPHILVNLSLQLLVLHGGSDLISDSDGSRILYRLVASSDKTLRLYEGFYHDIFSDPGHEKVLADLEKWLFKRAEQSGYMWNKRNSSTTSAGLIS